MNNTVAISGATGFLGRELSDFFRQNDHKVIQITRQDFHLSVDKLAEKLNGVGAVFHLAGGPVLQKWSGKVKKEIFNSRVDSTRNLVEAIAKTEEKPEMFYSASAVGIYDIYEVHDEFSSNYGNDFLSNVCEAWEKEALKLYDQFGIRLIIGRMGVVLGRSGGAFPHISKNIKIGVGNKIGDGFQSFPFIHISDFLSAMWYLWKKSSCTGVFNIVAPQLISNDEFTDELNRISGKKALLNPPLWVLKSRFGEGVTMFTHGQKVLPRRLKEENFYFLYPDISSTLEELFKA